MYGINEMEDYCVVEIVFVEKYEMLYGMSEGFGELKDQLLDEYQWNEEVYYFLFVYYGKLYIFMLCDYMEGIEEKVLVEIVLCELILEEYEC